ncbi:heteromeric transposase endonuclease subunit TnsA [Pedobacter sp. Hv1]|uniref:heteromeric transposase endonuclease subunit TnsA n=1 Tax=Pedobacter sp. Hv1 TaxID=1740090 RepID=UPI0006D8AF30|nr:heteromeric transposase endonuclease subunit TnsA [Pedobacter sp. Hv1]KQB99193.1 hypothetical protein AQF98_16575 [Pedobacter sp. Hv1]
MKMQIDSNDSFYPKRIVKSSKTTEVGVVTSRHDQKIKRFESSLEKDFFEILEFSRDVDRYVEQPVEIEYLINGERHYYTPDVLVYLITSEQPILFEVKSLGLLKTTYASAMHKFRAGRAYAKIKNMRFKVATEQFIRTPFLYNAKFLNRYRAFDQISEDDREILRRLFSRSEHNTADLIIEKAAASFERKAQLLYCLWHMVSIGEVDCDLTIPLTMSSELWIAKTN